MSDVKVKEKKPFWKKWWFWLIVVIVVGGIANSANGGGSSSTTASDTSTPATTEQTKAEPVAPKVGDVIDVGNAEVTVLSAKTYTVIKGEYGDSTPAEGGIYVGIAFKLKNTSDKAFGMFAFPSVKLKDASGNRYSADVSASGVFALDQKIDMKILSELNPGITVKDADAYEISTDSIKKPGWVIELSGDKTVEIPVTF